jgi:hypothetical protein
LIFSRFLCVTSEINGFEPVAQKWLYQFPYGATYRGG